MPGSLKVSGGPDLIFNGGSYDAFVTKLNAAGTALIYSTVTGRALDGREFGPSYWVRNLRQPVLFAQAVDEVLRATDGPTTFVELGPHPVLAPALKQSLAKSSRSGAVVETLRREEDERGCLLDAAGRLYVDGQTLLWDRVLSPCAPVSLPATIGGSAARTMDHRPAHWLLLHRPDNRSAESRRETRSGEWHKRRCTQSRGFRSQE